MSDAAWSDEELVRYVDGNLSADERTRLEENLVENSVLREKLRRIAEEAVVVADIHRSGSANANASLETMEIRNSNRLVGRSAGRGLSLWIGVVASIACVLLIGFLVFQFVGGRQSQSPEILTIQALNGPVEWTGEGGAVRDVLQVGSRLPGGTIELLSPDTWVEFKFNDGSAVTLSGRSTVTVSDNGQKLLHLRQGSLSADVEVQPESQPMKVHTYAAELTVLGTQFNVDVEESSTIVSVNQGRVAVKRLADNQTIDVPANHRVVAATDRKGEFHAVARLRSVTHWNSQLPSGGIYGKWHPRLNGLRAAPLLWQDCKKKEQEPLLLFLAAMSVSRGKESPVELRADARLRVRGKMDSPQDLIVGLTTQHLQGGFAGKHIAVREKNTLAESSDGEFELVFPVKEFWPQEPDYPKSAIGLGLYDWWCLTVNQDAGLTIYSVELLDGEQQN